MTGSTAMRLQDSVRPDFTVLVIEDDPGFAASMAESIRQDGSHVVIAGSGAAALQLSRQHDPDAVVIAATLCSGSGSELVAELRKDGLAARAAVILLTSTSMQALKAASVRGVDLVLSKPQNAGTFSGLLQFVRRQWRRGELPSVA